MIRIFGKAPFSAGPLPRPVRTRGGWPSNRIFGGDFHMASKKSAFFRPFLRFFLAFSGFLGYSPLRRGSFRRKTRPSRLAACPDGIGACFERFGVERQFRRISRLDGQAIEQNESRISHRREGRHSQKNRRSLL